jgi:hypothetical protein
MKNNIILFVTLSFAVIVGILVMSYSKLHRGGGSRIEQRVAQLKQMRELPQNASILDRDLVEKTSWWGNPLDPKIFWKDKTMWLDINATLAAHRVGRLYPPIPFGETNFSSYSEKDIVCRTGGSEGDSTAYHANDREAAFWNDFERTHPTPPEEIQRKQVEIEGGILASKNWNNISQKDINGILSLEKDRAISLGYPPEALTDDALYWSYVAHQNQQYQGATQPGQTLAVLHSIQSSSVDSKLITNSLNADQIELANAWKIAYLKRLKGQNVDQSYLNAYMQAWNLSSNQVFGAGNY